MILVIVGVLMVRLVRTAHQMSLTVVRLRTVVDKLTRETVGVAHRMKRIEGGDGSETPDDRDARGNGASQ